ncbi:MAG: hypothetical protein FJW32_07360 [Acidobacteria bacterium]|nr:hypothetical protein [Acidobacteriota bacterium]
MASARFDVDSLRYARSSLKPGESVFAANGGTFEVEDLELRVGRLTDPATFNGYARVPALPQKRLPPARS